MSADMLRFNNMFKSDSMILDLITYLKTRRLPSHLKTTQNFMKRAREFSLNKDGELVLTKSGQIVVKSKDREKVMKELYHDIKLGSAKGILSFYKLVSSKYINIRRSDCEDFLKKQTFYQLQRPLTHIVNKPIVATYPNQLYAIDLIDVEIYSKYNHQNKYILTIVDVFSGKCYLGKLTMKEAKKVAREFERITEMYPTYILCDNGTEFKGEFIDYCKENDIIIRNTTTYAPQSNGVVESKNKQVRKLIRDVFLRTGKQNWTKYIDDIEENLNDTYNSNKKATPNELWSNTTEKVKMPRRNLPESLSGALSKQQQEVKRMTAKQDNYDDKVLAVGDYVRIKMNALYSDIRRIVKQGKEKLLVVKYTPELYRIVKVVKPRNTKKLEYYVVNNENGIRPNRSFFLSDLQKVEPNANEGLKIKTNEQALELNRSWFISDNDNIASNN
jgi:hypothetical protein